MKQTLLIERVMDQTRLAVIEDGQLAELLIQRPGDENLSGNVYLGRMENVLPGMNAAFVDIGADKNGFLAAGDIGVDVRSDRGLAEALDAARIEKLARPGQSILVQAIKAQPGAKGPRLSSHVTLAGRLLVLLTDVRYVGVSKKLPDGERERLHGIGERLLEAGGAGLILRTAASGADEAAISDEYERLINAWRDILNRAAHGIAPKLLRDDNALTLKAVRDRLGEDTDALWADGADCHDELRGLAASMAPGYLDRIKLYDGATPLFDLYKVDAQADRALQKYVWLKSGGSLVIEETEALTAVDVNTGKNTGRRDAEETLFKNNCEAARELMRQLRLRDIGGIIVVDFIDMLSKEHREALLSVLRACAARDSVKVNVVGMTGLGLVEMTRKKARQSLLRQLTHTCSDCGGNGIVPSHETLARRIQREIWRRRRAGDASPLLVEAAPEVCGWLAKLGAPGGGPAYVHPDRGRAAGDYELSLADAARLPKGSKELK